MEMVVYPVGGATLGVTVPIVVEFGAKGARIGDPDKGVKISGVVGVGLGVPEVLLAVGGETKWGWSKERVAFLASMGAAKTTTGVAILILDELRKRAAYAFRKKRGTTLPITEGGEELEREAYPTEELVEEI